MKYNVMVTLTRTTTSTAEFEVSAKDEESAEEKISDRICKAQSSGKLDDFDWEECVCDDEFEYEVTA